MNSTKLIIEVHGLRLEYAIEHALAIVRQGKISGPKNRRQHCYHTVFQNGVTVSCVKRGDTKSERFIISQPRK